MKDQVSNPILTDRTSIEVDYRCPRELWWYKFAEGSGVVPAETPDHFTVGGEIHEDMEKIAAGWSLQEILDSLPSFESCNGDQFRLESVARRRGWVAGMARTVFPYIWDNFTIESIEKELILERDGIWIQVKPDLLLRQKKRGRLVYIEYKSSAGLSQGFMQHWQTAIQLHLGIKAVEEETGEKVDYAQVIGLSKGRWQYGRLHHPFVYGYRHITSGAWRSDYIRSDDWVATGAWDYPGTVLDWMGMIGEEKERAQFAWTAPVFYDGNFIERVEQYQAYRQAEIYGNLEACRRNERLRNIIFPLKPLECQPTFGPACPYKAACFNASVGADPLNNMFIKRTPHHELDMIGVE